MSEVVLRQPIRRTGWRRPLHNYNRCYCWRTLSSTALKLKQGINHVSKLFFLMFIRDECSTCFKWGFFPFLCSCTMYNHSVFWSCLVEDFCFFHICLLNTGRQNYRVQSTFCFYTILKNFINIKNSVFVSIKCKYGILDCLRHAFYM